jgi:hypothetical protein
LSEASPTGMKVCVRRPWDFNRVTSATIAYTRQAYRMYLDRSSALPTGEWLPIECHAELAPQGLVLSLV